MSQWAPDPTRVGGAGGQGRQHTLRARRFSCHSFYADGTKMRQLLWVQTEARGHIIDGNVALSGSHQIMTGKTQPGVGQESPSHTRRLIRCHSPPRVKPSERAHERRQRCRLWVVAGAASAAGAGQSLLTLWPQGPVCVESYSHIALLMSVPIRIPLLGDWHGGARCGCGGKVRPRGVV